MTDTRANAKGHSRHGRIPKAQRDEIAARIRNLRKQRLPKTSQEELAREAGINPATLSHIERGKRVPDLASLLLLAEHLGVNPGALLDDSVAAVSKGAPHAQNVDLAQIRAAFAEVLASFATSIAAAIAEWHETHVFREDGGRATGTAGASGVHGTNGRSDPL